ncbi:MAG: hypothetical protein ACP5G0_00395 [Desulfomonilia bacterium]
MKRGPVQIILMRTTDGKTLATIGPLWVKVFLLLLVALIGVMIGVGVLLTQESRVLEEKERKIVAQQKEIQDLSVQVCRKEEEIISLKNKLSMAITYAPSTTLLPAAVPDLKPPIAEITEVSLGERSISFRLENIKTAKRSIASGHLFAVFASGNEIQSYPASPVVNGVPEDWSKGIDFSIRNFKPMSVQIPPDLSSWENLTFYIFDREGNLCLAMPFTKEQLK